MRANELTLIKCEYIASTYQKINFGRIREQKVTCVYYDFVIDGQSLQLLLDPDIDVAMLKDWGGNITFYTSSACPEWRWEMHQALLGNREGDLIQGRVGLYYCRDCFDIGDGIDSVKVDKQSEIVRWASFGWSDFENEFEPFVNVGPYNFDSRKLTKSLGTAVFELDRTGLRAVLNKIDVLGVTEKHVGVCDEYDCLISDILAILHEGGTDKQIQEYLAEEFRTHFEITYSKKQIKQYAKEIMQWWQSWPA